VEADMHTIADRSLSVIRAAHPAYWLALIATLSLAAVLAIAAQVATP
jgi:hypothetical protein